MFRLGFSCIGSVQCRRQVESGNKEENPCYLDRPRFNFAGKFRADVGTINNFYDNYNTETFQAPVDQTIISENEAGFNAMGTGNFEFTDCYVTGVCRQGHLGCTNDDAFVGTPVVTGTLSGTSAKLVDIDTDNQLVSRLYGLTVAIGAFRGIPPVLTGRLRTSAVTHTWETLAEHRFQLEYDGYMGRFQSLLEDLRWNDTMLVSDKYAFMREIKESSPYLLSVSFALYGYRMMVNRDDFTFGRIVGTIGPAGENQPENFVKGRILKALPKENVVESQSERHTLPVLNLAQFKISCERLSVDFSNAFSTIIDNSINVVFNTRDIGQEICLSIGNQSDHKFPPHPIAKFPLTNEWYERTGGIADISLSKEMIDVANDNPLVMINCSNSSIILMAELEYYVIPTTNFVNSLNPGDSWTVNMYASRFGKKATNQTIHLFVRVDSDNIRHEDLFLAEKGLTFNGHLSALAVTDSTGHAAITLHAGDPGNSRPHVDGCIYKVYYAPIIIDEKQSTGPDHPDLQPQPLSVRVYDNFTWEDPPTWYGEKGVYRIFKEYDNLYPIMRRVLTLRDYDSVTKPRNIRYIKSAMTRPFDDPSYMPVSRDLSESKRQMILAWLSQKPPKKGRLRDEMSLNALRRHLQTAIQIEHSTIPMYLYAMYSIKPGSNVKAREIIREIVMEEMVHMSLAANVLTAIDGKPDFVSPQFVPVFPGPMPGAMHPDITLRLSKLSKSLIRDVFLKIETPQYFRDEEEELLNNTIGGFYQTIKRYLKRLEKEASDRYETIFTGPRNFQVEYNLIGPLKIFPVYDIWSAIKAIDEIVRQGEGNSQVDPMNDYSQLAHYYRFGEILHERRLVRQSNGSWNYTGEPVPFDADGIWPLAESPHIRDYPQGSRARHLLTSFSHRYLALLSELQNIFNGTPNRIENSFSAMFAMSMSALEIVSQPKSNGCADEHLGPVFENEWNLYNEQDYGKLEKSVANQCN